MRLSVIINTSDPETAWNALRLANAALDAGHMVGVFLLGGGVELESIRHETFNVASEIERMAQRHVSLLGCSTCLGLRRKESAKIVKSHLKDLVSIIADSDKLVTFG